MLLALLAAATVHPVRAEAIVLRDSYGIPHIFAPDVSGAFEQAGYAVAEDRLWQMEMSRRSARGQLSELLGQGGVRSDLNAIRFGYTNSEYAHMFAELPEDTQAIFRSYAVGINRRIGDLATSGKLPMAYMGAKPRPWEVTDSLAISVNLIRQFGVGGAGEIRNLLLYTYLRDRLKERTRLAIEDILWQNDSASIPTVADSDDPLKGKSPFPKASEKTLASHLALLPKANLLELLPAIRIEERAEMKDLAAELGLPHRWGSYAMVVGKDRSALGVPILLNGPQMGFSGPSVIHQMSIECPDYTAVGLDVPGMPGVLVGHSPYAAWGLTSGIADTDDIFFVQLNPDNPGQYRHGGAWKDFEVAETSIKVKGAESVAAKREISAYGPVVIKSTSTGVAYVLKSTLWMSEVENSAHALHIPSSKTMADFQNISRRLSATFNFFVATTQGDIGWFYCGLMPVRSEKVDPRFPTPGTGQFDWSGTISGDQMPFVINPRNGIIANWNNKPVSWWPNMDTPAWGRIFRNESIVDRLRNLKVISPQVLQGVTREIATKGFEYKHFLPRLLDSLKKQPLNAVELQAKQFLDHWDGTELDGSVQPVIYDAWFNSLREEIFAPTLGTLLSPATFRLVVQPTLIWNSMHGKTKIDYLGDKSADEVNVTAFRKTVSGLAQRLGNDVATWRYRSPRIQWKSLPDVHYNDRGTYIQVVELWNTPRGLFVAPPGVSEDPTSPFFSDQRELAANWAYAPMLWKRSDLPAR
ncbi:MAG: penicillin acylase family protein [Armatimonadetes bacterium]|nr:penicillin acylase family protein [Armatimonadota bacterium]